MFDLKERHGRKVLVWVDRFRRPFERGTWVEIGHEKDKNIQYFIEVNKQLGLEVEMDEKGYYRALVLKE